MKGRLVVDSSGDPDDTEEGYLADTDFTYAKTATGKFTVKVPEIHGGVISARPWGPTYLPDYDVVEVGEPTNSGGFTTFKLWVVAGPRGVVGRYCATGSTGATGGTGHHTPTGWAQARTNEGIFTVKGPSVAAGGFLTTSSKLVVSPYFKTTALNRNVSQIGLCVVSGNTGTFIAHYAQGDTGTAVLDDPVAEDGFTWHAQAGDDTLVNPGTGEGFTFEITGHLH